MNQTLNLSAEQVQTLLNPKTIRTRALQIFEHAQAGKTHFNVHLDQLDKVCDFVFKAIKENYPDLEIPLHARFRHFTGGGVNRIDVLSKKLSHASKEEIAKAHFDLVIASVLLDAGAGMQWKYKDVLSHTTIARSEGLAVASFNLFMEGFFSSDKNNPYQADAKRLKSITAAELASGFQVSSSNPLLGIEGRVELLNALGKTIENNFQVFGKSEPRVGNLYSYLCKASENGKIKATEILSAVLIHLGSIWPSRLSSNGISLGDTWHYPPFKNDICFESLVPFHKLSQWLTYSLIEPVLLSGIDVTSTNELTGLPEYRNGGLLLDLGLISLKDPAMVQKQHEPQSALIIEWRALTVYFLDQIGSEIQKKLNRTPQEFPLAKVLEGGTWSAGRKIASQLRSDGGPPLQLKSDGTVF